MESQNTDALSHTASGTQRYESSPGNPDLTSFSPSFSTGWPQSLSSLGDMRGPRCFCPGHLWRGKYSPFKITFASKGGGYSTNNLPPPGPQQSPSVPSALCQERPCKNIIIGTFDYCL